MTSSKLSAHRTVIKYCVGKKDDSNTNHKRNGKDGILQCVMDTCIHLAHQRDMNFLGPSSRHTRVSTIVSGVSPERVEFRLLNSTLINPAAA